jgi:hypothetical protein
MRRCAESKLNRHGGHAVTGRTIRNLLIGLSFVVCASLGATDASAAPACPNEIAEVKRIQKERIDAIPNIPANGKRRQDELYRGNHCINSMRRAGADCKALLQTYIEVGKCPCLSGPPTSWCG